MNRFMKYLIVKRNKLKYDAMRLREVKFEKGITLKQSFKLNKEQNDLWNKYQFYDKLINANRKEKQNE